MAYSKRNLLNKIIEIQTIVLRESKRGVTQKHIYDTLIKNTYHISYSTFNNYLARNAKKELEQLDKQNAQDTQTCLF